MMYLEMPDTETNNQNEVMNLPKQIQKQLKELDITVNQNRKTRW